MPALEEPLYTYLTTALAGDVGDRIYPTLAPEGATFPYITYQRISTQRLYDHDPFEDTLPWVRARVQFACADVTTQGAIEVAEALVAALSGYSGDMDGLAVGSIDIVNESERRDPQTKVIRRLVDAFVSYQEVPLAS